MGGNFDRVIENIKTIKRFKEQYNSEYPHLTWQFVVFGHNEHELPMAKKMAKELNMSFISKMSWDSDFSPIKDRDFVMAETGWPAVTRDEFMDVTGTSYKRNVCYELWHSPRINWDGKVLGCCWNSWGEFGGNAFQDGYIPSINSEKINYVRKMLRGKAEPVDDTPCQTCKLYLQMRDSNSFLSLKEIFPPNPLSYRLNNFFDEHPLLYRSARFIYRAFGLKRLAGLVHS